MTQPHTTDAHGQRQRGRQYSAFQLRMDTWNELQVRTAWLRELTKAGQDTAQPHAQVGQSLDVLAHLEPYWAFPGPARMDELARLYQTGSAGELADLVAGLGRLLVGDAYRERGGAVFDEPTRDARRNGTVADPRDRVRGRPYFEVLFVDGADAYDHDSLRQGLAACRRDADEFVYDIVSVPSVQDAAIAVLFNPTIQAVFLRYNFAFHTTNHHPALRRYLDALAAENMPNSYGLDRSVHLARVLRRLRPELDLYLVTDTPLDTVAGNMGSAFRRTFYRLEQYMEQHLSILRGVRERHETPFFDALRKFAAKPTGVFHALPIARGKSMTTSHWAKDFHDFYGPNLFMAETSATSGGLDSLLQPRGPIRKAQEAAARAFGARQTFFVTNGTSTANKIVHQALVRPGDIVLIDRDCHKSHHYAMVLAGAHPVYLDSYPLQRYSMYGAVPLEEIERQLLALKAQGKLDRVRMLVLTNCTFDGITYDPARVMRRVLAIKPDMIFLWDEAWFAYARFSPTLRRRTAMDAASTLRALYRGSEYRIAYANQQPGGEPMADPTEVRVRVYATQSTHKTLTSLRQGSMIHVYDEDFEQKASGPMHEAIMTHTSTSPNYQIIASLDAGRRQVELEGYELIEKTIDLTMTLRKRVNEHPDIARFFRVLRPADMIPAPFRPSGLEFYYNPQRGWGTMDAAWRQDEFTLDPTRVTLEVGATGLDGDTLRHLLMDRYDIQINKTSRNTALFMPNIGSTRGDVAYLVETLADICRRVEDALSTESPQGLNLHTARVDSLLEGPPLPNFSRFHEAFRDGNSPTAEGDLRRAFFLAYDNDNTAWVRLDRELLARIRGGQEYVSAAFVTPYPPGFPILVPGQVFSAGIIAYLLALDVKEIHGYHPTYGLRVFEEHALRR
ncbi:MAG: aminotransferase class I/II-fold pyridoxal phosphate-dependent enzyme [Phycisphaeraceae bacterium]|nr:aminotransferase class I/II-fold pyridoxal phosphate-dependent enzyme [Phycisphaeraceae bacterium]